MECPQKNITARGYDQVKKLIRAWELADDFSLDQRKVYWHFEYVNFWLLENCMTVYSLISS